MKIKHISLLCLATAICFLPQSCDKNDPSIAMNGTSVSSAGMNLKVSTNTIAAVKSDAGTPTRVFGDPEDGIIMTEYVSDIADIMPETKGTVITTGNITTTTNPINGGSFLVNAYRAFSQSELMETGDKDTDDNDDDVYNNGTMSKTTKTVRDFSMLSSYNGSSWSWPSGKQPHWRNKSVFSIWSMFPANSTSLSPAALTPAMPQPDWTNTALDAIADVDPTGKTDDEIAAAEKARQEAIQAYLRSMTFDYELPLYAPTTASTSIYKDLLFAYNEEMREFEVEDGKLKEDANGKHIIKNGKSETFDVKFYHALAAVKFVLSTTTIGADIHSVTLCYTDATTGNIVTTDGLATKGTCTASATGGDGSREVSFNWTSLTNKKPMHFVFNDNTYSATSPDPNKVSSGYANTGDGVLFMIPQTATGLKVIVEFSKYGSTEYYTKVITSPSTSGLNINWEAGKCYTYTFNIGEFHVPGENIAPNLTRIYFEGLKNANEGVTQPDTPLSVKGVTKVGLVLDKYGLACKDGQTAVMYGICDGVDKYKDYSADGKKTAHSVAELITLANDATKNPTFQFNFVGVSTTAVSGTDGKLFTFGSDTVDETYKNLYIFSETNGGNAKPPSTYTTNNGSNLFYVFNLDPDTDEFEVMFKTGAGDSSGSFDAYPRCIMVLEVKIDPNLPGNFNTIDWDAINNS